MWRVYLAVETLVVRRWSRCQVGQTRTSYMYCCYSGWWFGTWLVWLSIYRECHHPNWLIQRGWNHQPVFVTNLCGFWSKSWKGNWTWQTAWPGEWPRQSQRRESDQGRPVFSSGSVWNGYIYVYKYTYIYAYTCIPNAVEWMIIKWAMASQSVSHNQRVYPQLLELHRSWQDISEGKKGTTAPSRKVGYCTGNPLCFHGFLGSMSNHLFFG